MKLSTRLIATAITAALALSAAPSRAAGILDCMAQSYSREQLARIDQLSQGFDIDDERSDAPAAQMAILSVEKVDACGAGKNWSEEAATLATYFEISRVFERAYRRSATLSAGQLALLDKALGEGDRAELWRIIEIQASAGLEDKDSQLSDAESSYLDEFVRSLGLGGDGSITEKVGILLGFMGVQRVARREFAALTGQE